MFLDRREFIHQSAGLAGLVGAGYFGGDVVGEQERPAQPPGGAGERINVACIGVRGQGLGHVRGYANRHNCRVTYICDVDTAVMGAAAIAAQGQQDSTPRLTQDFRRALDDRNVHAVSIATPNHWHALAAIWAMQAGKHVYVEKPVSHNVWEGRRIVEASRHFNKICQTGTQIRSQPGIRQAIEYLRAGNLGRCTIARGLCYKPRGSIGRVTADQTPPRTMDYNLWCGPAANRPPRRNSGAGPVHYDWHWIWEYGNGDLGNQGIHQMDVARWGLGKNELCRSAISVGGRFGYTDDGETPNTQLCHFDYGDSELIFEVRGLTTAPYRGASIGNIFHCANGYLVMTTYNNAIAFDNDNRELRRFTGSADHFGNFISAIRSGRRQDLNADILEGHLSSALCHLANISYRLGRTVAFDRRNGAFGENREANDTLNRTVDHLRGNSVAIDTAQLTIGRRLNVNAQNENFGDDRDANRLLTREYRTGFVVPERF
jgi:predicted dehydrogenase